MQGINQTQPSSLFSGEGSQDNDQDKDINNKFQIRQNKFTNEENFTQIKENTMTNELSLGQNHRDKIFTKRRLKANYNTEGTKKLKNILQIPLELYQQCDAMKVNKSQFTEIVTKFNSNNQLEKYMGLVGIRKLTSLSDNSPIQELIDLDVTSQLISFLDNYPPEFQYESLWCLINISYNSGEQANNIINKGGIEKIDKIMDSQITELKEQAIWLIGNLCGESNKIRDYLIKNKIYEKILTILSSSNIESIIKKGIWTLANFFRAKPIPSYEVIVKSIKVLAKTLPMFPNDSEFLTDICFMLNAITEKYKDTITDIIDIGIISGVINCLNVDDDHLKMACLRIIGNIASGNANQTQSLIDHGILSHLKVAIYSGKKSIKKECSWILSNIAAGTQKQIETLISENFLPILKDKIEKDEPEIQKECIWAACNLTSAENPEYLKKILSQGILDIICNCLKNLTDAKYLAVCLEAFGNLLAFGKKSNPNGVNPIVEKVDNMGMFEVLEKLQLHPVEIVYEKILKILETYFDTQNEYEFH